MPRTRNSTGTRARPRSGASGFTLIELLVVVLIIGITAATIVLSVGITGRDSELEKESDRLNALLNYAREKAELTSSEFGLYLHDNDYEFLRYDGRKALWRSVDEDDALRLRELPAGLTLRLTVEGRPVVLKRAGAEKKPTTDEERDKRDKERVPHVMIFSNGDLTPFTLTVEREDAGRSITMASNDQGKIEAQPLVEPNRR
ncbi:MAG TPA: type II secretion system minor pseudopilin GspH [Steroidobacteraceae bacterium]|jgi:general secretion pathway protein H|nr:type II secretion system minor pseudopilin GspH [Steroidobacteraceae bacterium]